MLTLSKARGDEPASLMGRICDNHEKFNLSPRESAWLSATMLYVLTTSVVIFKLVIAHACFFLLLDSAAGSETSAGVLTWWTQAMLLYPEAQASAQQELDAVVGRDRVPSFDDYERLPYIRAMVKEVRCLSSFRIIYPSCSAAVL